MLVRAWLTEARAPAGIQAPTSFWNSFCEAPYLCFVAFGSPGLLETHKDSELSRQKKLRAKAAARKGPAAVLLVSRDVLVSAGTRAACLQMST